MPRELLYIFKHFSTFAYWNFFQISSFFDSQYSRKLKKISKKISEKLACGLKKWEKKTKFQTIKKEKLEKIQFSKKKIFLISFKNNFSYFSNSYKFFHFFFSFESIKIIRIDIRNFKKSFRIKNKIFCLKIFFLKIKFP